MIPPSAFTTGKWESSPCSSQTWRPISESGVTTCAGIPIWKAKSRSATVNGSSEGETMIAVGTTGLAEPQSESSSVSAVWNSSSRTPRGISR